MEIITKISGLTFSNRTTGFFILRASVDGDNHPVSIKGSFPGISIQIGLKAKFTGIYVDDAKYGRQFLASNCEILVEKGRVGIIQYLTANVPSIGQITAHKLYEALGDELVEILNSTPEQIRELGFLQDRQADAIIKEWSQSSENRTIAIFLTDLGLSSFQVRSVVTKLGIGQIIRDKIKENPYCLYECPGVGFGTADLAARKLGIGVDDSRRISAIIIFVMNELAQSDGHVYCYSNQILEYISGRLFKKHSVSPFTHGDYMSESHYYSAISELRENGSIVTDSNRNYLTGNWASENDSAMAISSMVAQEPFELGNLVNILDEFEHENNLQLSDEQRDAFFLLNKNRVCVVSGAPGTGKTLLTSAFVHLFETNNLHYQLLSPTGIAAKRLSQVTGKPASTIHRALGYGRNGEWEHNRQNKYFCDAVIVDEMSMVDSNTFYHLVSALPPTTILILVGDAAQLPSVGAGDVLRSLMNCSDVPHVSLARIYRQEEASDIIKVAHKILNGNPIDTSFNRASDVIFLEYPKERIMDEVLSMSKSLKDKSDQSQLTFQIIAPIYAGDLGIDNLNLSLREVLNPEYLLRKANYVKHGDVNFFEGDRVMVTKNDYERMIFNGDVGKIQRISIKQDEFEVKIFNWFDQEAAIPTYVDKIFTFKIEEAKNVMRVAYACSVHRCVSPNTLVETPDGLVRISDIPDSGSISTPIGQSEYINKVVNPSGRMLRITTSDGYMLEVTPDHGMNTWDGNEYVRRPAKNLSVNNILPLRLGAEWYNQDLQVLPEPCEKSNNEIIYNIPNKINCDVAEFLGIMVADGTIYRAGFRLVKNSPDVINRFIQLCKILFNVDAKQKDHDGTDCAEVNSTYISKWLLRIDGLGPNNKKIPQEILRSSLTVQASFLRGLFEDGTVNVNRDDKVDHIELVSKYYQLYCDVKIMLLRFNIISGYAIRYKVLSDGKKAPYYNIYIYGINVHVFAEKIGFITQSKQNRALLDTGIDRNYQIPVSRREIVALCDANGGPSFFTFSDKNALTRHRMSRRQLSSLLQRATVITNEHRILSDRLRFHHSRITSIDEFEGPSMCVEVPDGHQFIQNGFSGWNCQGQEFDYVLLPMTKQYGGMLYKNIIYTALTRAKKKVFIFGDMSAFTYASNNERDSKRNTNLAELVHNHLIHVEETPDQSSVDFV